MQKKGRTNFMIIQLSAGQGPEECQLAVGKLFEALQKEFQDIQQLSAKAGRRKGCYDSISFTTGEDLRFLEGTILWICKSPFRPEHKRKNWFVDVSVIPEKEEVNREADYRIEKFHCGGKGGQNVNKVETGVRVIHLPTGIAVTSTEERSQYMNKQRAMEKLTTILREQEENAKSRQTNQAWREHNCIVRGNPVRTYAGMDFVRKKLGKTEKQSV